MLHARSTLVLLHSRSTLVLLLDAACDVFCLSFMWLRFCLGVCLSICPVVHLSSAADEAVKCQPLFNLEEAHQGDQERYQQ